MKLKPIKLKPCPFCGCKSIWIKYAGQYGDWKNSNDWREYWCECSICGCKEHYKYSKPQFAAKEWNTRTKERE